ncbi:coiled-coil domain-containing protein CG32809-like isoform X2 [Corticium candelabrum]|nr:coiled-coil domain-containing protein CG32809-like isoform X2 [Corticium candelabrum]XP_062517704.1 coiled-coil domain-containing protein CG32809-like isoform X2 [Corticium candelabrum]
MRRHTLTGDEARAKAEGLRSGGKQRLAREREKFLDLLKSRYPEQADAIASELEWGGKTSNKPERREETIFLQFGGETKRALLPHPLTLDSLKEIFVSTFAPAIDGELMDPPHGAIYIYEPSGALYYELTELADIRDNCVLAFHPFNLRASFSPPLSPVGVDATGQTLWQLNQGLEGDVGNMQSESSFSLDKLHSMQEQLSKLTGLVQQAVLKGQSLGDLVNADGKTEYVGGITKASSATSIPSRSSTSLGVDFPDAGPPKPRRLHISNNNNNNSDTLAVEPHKYDDSHTTRWHTGRYPSKSLSVDEKQLVVRAADGVRRNIQLMRMEVEAVRKQHQEQCETFATFMKETADRVAKAITLHRPRNIVVNGKKRAQLIEDEDAFQRESNNVVQEIQDLDTLVEDIRVDVVDRRCKVDMTELNNLSKPLQLVARNLLDVKKKFQCLSDNLKPVMASELQVIVDEEKLLEEQAPALEAAIAKCKKAHGTLIALKRYGSVQQHRMKSVPLIITSVENPDYHEVLDNISAMAPNHIARLQAIEAAETSYKKKKQLKLSSEAEIQYHVLEGGRARLKPVSYMLHDIEAKHADLIRRMYLQEKQHTPQQQRPRSTTWSQPRTRRHQDQRYYREAHDHPMNSSQDEWQGSRGSVHSHTRGQRDRSHRGYQNGPADRQEGDFRQPYSNERATRPPQYYRTSSDHPLRNDEWSNGDLRRSVGDMRDVISHSYSRAGPSVSYDQNGLSSNSNGFTNSKQPPLRASSPRNSHNQSTVQDRKQKVSRSNMPLPPTPNEEVQYRHQSVGGRQHMKSRPRSQVIGVQNRRDMHNGGVVEYLTSDL